MVSAQYLVTMGWPKEYQGEEPRETRGNTEGGLGNNKRRRPEGIPRGPREYQGELKETRGMPRVYQGEPRVYQGEPRET